MGSVQFRALFQHVMFLVGLHTRVQNWQPPLDDWQDFLSSKFVCSTRSWARCLSEHPHAHAGDLLSTRIIGLSVQVGRGGHGSW